LEKGRILRGGIEWLLCGVEQKGKAKNKKRTDARDERRKREERGRGIGGERELPWYNGGGGGELWTTIMREKGKAGTSAMQPQSTTDFKTEKGYSEKKILGSENRRERRRVQRGAIINEGSSYLTSWEENNCGGGGGDATKPKKSRIYPSERFFSVRRVGKKVQNTTSKTMTYEKKK